MVRYLVLGVCFTFLTAACTTDGGATSPTASSQPVTAATVEPPATTSSAHSTSTTTTATTASPTVASTSTTEPASSNRNMTGDESGDTVVTLRILTEGVRLPWRSGSWTIDEFGYESQFAVLRNGDHLFGIYPEPDGAGAPIPGTGQLPFTEADIVAFCADRMNSLGPNGSALDFASTVEEVRFMGRPAMMSVCVGPSEGRIEHAFVELFFGIDASAGQWIELWASNHEWEDIDAEDVAAFAPVFREFVAAHSGA